MKLLGGAIMFAAITAVAVFADLRPSPDQAWVLWVISMVNGSIFFAGLFLFARGLRREILDEVRRDRSGSHSDSP